MSVAARVFLVVLRVIVMAAVLPWLVVQILQIFLASPGLLEPVVAVVPEPLLPAFERWDGLPPWYAWAVLVALLLAVFCPWTSRQRRRAANDYAGFKEVLPNNRGELTGESTNPSLTQPLATGQLPLVSASAAPVAGVDYQGRQIGHGQGDPGCRYCRVKRDRRPLWRLEGWVDLADPRVARSDFDPLVAGESVLTGSASSTQVMPAYPSNSPLPSS